MGSQWSDLDRPPLSRVRLQRVIEGGQVWRELRVVTTTTSTNADVAAAARDGAPEGLVVIAEHQDAGRGRLDRTWSSPPRAAVLVSVLLRPGTPPAGWSVISLLTGLAVADAVIGVGRVDAGLKWPNDVLVAGRKVAGILAERVGDGAGGAVVVGVGLNVSTRAEELPVATATSLALAGGSTDREVMAKELLRALARRYVAWRDAGGDPAAVLPAYRERCETIGQQVSVELPEGQVVRGTAVGVDDSGRLVVRTADGDERAWSVGDVTHLRAEG